jgi:hypothetical protein
MNRKARKFWLSVLAWLWRFRSQATRTDSKRLIRAKNGLAVPVSACSQHNMLVFTSIHRCRHKSSVFIKHLGIERQTLSYQQEFWGMTASRELHPIDARTPPTLPARRLSPRCAGGTISRLRCWHIPPVSYLSIRLCTTINIGVKRNRNLRVPATAACCYERDRAIECARSRTSRRKS